MLRARQEDLCLHESTYEGRYQLAGSSLRALGSGRTRWQTPWGLSQVFGAGSRHCRIDTLNCCADLESGGLRPGCAVDGSK